MTVPGTSEMVRLTLSTFTDLAELTFVQLVGDGELSGDDSDVTVDVPRVWLNALWGALTEVNRAKMAKQSVKELLAGGVSVERTAR